MPEILTYSTTLYECEYCFATVRRESVEKHEYWHDRLYDELRDLRD